MIGPTTRSMIRNNGSINDSQKSCEFKKKLRSSNAKETEIALESLPKRAKTGEVEWCSNKIVSPETKGDKRLPEILSKSQIVETNSFADITKFIKPNNLILIDLDLTTFKTPQTLGSDPWFRWRVEHYKKSHEPKEALSRTLNEWYAIQFLTKMEIAEKGTEKVIQYMQKEGFHVMGLTTRGSALANPTIARLNELNVDFSKSSPSNKKHVFLHDDEVVLYDRGVLFTSGVHKGEALFKFLTLIEKQLPLKTIDEIDFINDRRPDLAQVQETCEQNKIHFTGLRYGHLDHEVHNFSEDIAIHQFEKFGQILSDEELNHLRKT